MDNVELNTQSTIIKKENRNSNLELLRIVSMIMIIAHHYSVHGGWNIGNELSLSRFIVQFLSLGGKLGVNCFILITGYFMINSNFNRKKLLKFMGQVLFYALTITILFKIFKLSDIGITETIKSIFPIIFVKYWFATAYAVLYLLIPYLNKFINSLTCKEHKQLLFILTILLSIAPTFTNTLLGTDSVMWFMYLYLISSYLRKYPNGFFDKTGLFFFIFTISYIFIILSVIAFDFLGLRITVFSYYGTYFSDMNKLPLLICSVSLFIFFKNLSISSNKIINSVSMTTFGIYLIHDNNLVRGYLWSHVSQNILYYDSKWLFLHAIITIVLVFVVCMIIDYLRIILIEKPLLKIINNKFK